MAKMGPISGAKTGTGTGSDASVVTTFAYRTAEKDIPQLDLQWLLSLEQQRKAHRQGSFLSTDHVPRRSVIEQDRIIEALKKEGFTAGETVHCLVLLFLLFSKWKDYHLNEMGVLIA